MPTPNCQSGSKREWEIAAWVCVNMYCEPAARVELQYSLFLALKQKNNSMSVTTFIFIFINILNIYYYNYNICQS
jgi:uncharacterized membrane protein YecN with MAPEG domain